MQGFCDTLAFIPIMISKTSQCGINKALLLGDSLAMTTTDEPQELGELCTNTIYLVLFMKLYCIVRYRMNRRKENEVLMEISVHIYNFTTKATIKG